MDYKKIKFFADKIKYSRPKILVIGDVMIDSYIFGSVKRLSPEAPVPILKIKSERNSLGGAGNVLHNLINLGVDADLETIIGSDESGKLVKNYLNDLGLKTDSILTSTDLYTTKKIRFISKGQHLLRVDKDSKKINGKKINSLTEKIINKISSFDGIIISDYDKGICTSNLVTNVIKTAKKKKIPVYIDPKGVNWDRYRNATCITPNKKEVEEQLSMNLEELEDYELAAKLLKKKFKLGSCLITKSNEGMTFYGNNIIKHKSVGIKEVFDVSGAGDTVIACFVSSLCSGLSLEDSIEFSSIISSEVVTYSGTTPYHKKMLTKYV